MFPVTKHYFFTVIRYTFMHYFTIYVFLFVSATEQIVQLQKQIKKHFKDRLHDTRYPLSMK